MARIIQTGAIVGDGQFVDALHVSRVFERDGRKIRQGLEQGEVPIVEALDAYAIDKFDDSQAMVPEPHRHRHDRTRLRPGLLIDLGKKTRVLADVRNDHGLLALRHPTGNALPHLDADVLERMSILADG